MVLKVQIKSGQKLVINGAVLENASTQVVSLLVHNQVSILRQQDIMTHDEAITPATRVYYALQCLYLFPEEKTRHLALFKDFLTSFTDAVPSSCSVAEEVCACVEGEAYFKALKVARKLIARERRFSRMSNKGLLKSYSTAIQPGNPRRTEAWALLQAAVRMKVAQESGNVDEMRAALRLNWRLWTIIQSDLLDSECTMPSDLRSGVLSLSNFVDKQSVAFLAKPEVHLLSALISINRELSAGLSSEGDLSVDVSASDEPREEVGIGRHDIQT